jgi:hypothetical protein
MSRRIEELSNLERDILDLFEHLLNERDLSIQEVEWITDIQVNILSKDHEHL